MKTVRPQEQDPHHHADAPCQIAAAAADEAETLAASILKKKLPKGTIGVVFVMTQHGECKNGGMSGNLMLEGDGEDSDNEIACLLYVQEWVQERLAELEPPDDKH